MSADHPIWLIDNATSIAAVIISVVSLTWTIISSQRTEVRSRRPVIVFEYANEGWCVENVGNGPAIEILLAFRGDETPWKYPIRIPPLAQGARYQIKELGSLNVRHLGASYRDSAGDYYSTLSVNDRNIVKHGRALPDFKEDEIIRHWHGINLQDKVEVTRDPRATS